MGWIRVPLVSLQRIAPGDAVTRHVAWGVLAGPDTVVAGVPADGLGDGVGEWFEVLLASPSGRQYAIERIAVERIEVSRVAGFRGALATVTLAQASRHATFAGDFEPRAFTALAAGFGDRASDGAADRVSGGAAEPAPDLWSVLAGIGFVPQDVLDRPASRLAAVAAQEAEQSRGRLVEREFRSAVTASSIFCCNWFVRTCCKTVRQPEPDGPVEPEEAVLLDGPLLRLP